MTKNLGRILCALILVTGAFVFLASPAEAASEGTRKLKLDTSYVGWSSNGMHNDAAACGPFTASEDAVVWHFHADLPEGAEDAAIKSLKVRFAGKHDVEVESAKNGTRVDLWARVSVSNPDDPELARQGAHTSVRRVNVKLSKKIAASSEATLTLGNVCYVGLGPVGEINIALQSFVCDSYSRIRGNEITSESAQWDDTNGGYEDWKRTYDGNAPKVRLRSKARRGCEFDGGQQFAVGTTAWMEDYHRADGCHRPSRRDPAIEQPRPSGRAPTRPVLGTRPIMVPAGCDTAVGCHAVLPRQPALR